ncbi:mu-type opioid receptor-like [Convolutriloba macropyga]|uniref:mu-type opioid receptor-like n=1 Tax=Convolutriloba macropyga TaxID=536237 RepID=UPI003F51EA74
MEVLDIVNNITDLGSIAPKTWEDVYPFVAMVTISLNFTSSLLSILGCIGNSFTMIIISKWKNISSGAAFMFSLALTDLAALSYDGIVETLLPLMGVNVVSLHGSLCPIFSFISWMTTFSSFYLTILFSLDKCLAVYFPLKYREYGKPKACVIATLSLYVVAAIFSAPLPFVTRLDPKTGLCEKTDFSIVSEHYINEIRSDLQLYSAGIAPIIILFILLVLTIGKMRYNESQKRKKNSVSAAEQQIKLQNRRNAEITRQMITVTLLMECALITTTTIYVIRTYMTVESLEDEATFAVFKGLLAICLQLVNSGNFYLYVIFGKRFRTNFFQLIKGQKFTA